MATKPSKSERRRVSVVVNAPLLDADAKDTRPPVAVYAYSAGGALLAQSPTDAKGQARLALDLGAGPTAVRMLAGPAAEDKEAPALEDLLRRGAT